MRLIDADVLLEKVREIRKLALDRAVETPANMPFPIYQNPAYIRYSTQADEREKFKVMIEEAPSLQPERKKPVFKTGEDVYHVSYADGTGGFEKTKWADWTCPDCGWFVGEQYIPRRRNQQKCNYCAKCGCAIDWSDADMRGKTE